MTNLERQEITEKLVGLGYWEADMPGDPTIDYHDAKTLHDFVGAKLSGNVFLVSTNACSYSSARQVLIIHGEHTYPLVSADSYPESICLAALALPQFLKEHPECAANQDRGCKTKA